MGGISPKVEVVQAPAPLPQVVEVEKKVPGIPVALSGRRAKKRPERPLYQKILEEPSNPTGVTLKDQVRSWFEEEPSRLNLSGQSVQNQLRSLGITASVKYVNNIKKELSKTG